MNFICHIKQEIAMTIFQIPSDIFYPKGTNEFKFLLRYMVQTLNYPFREAERVTSIARTREFIVMKTWDGIVKKKVGVWLH